MTSLVNCINYLLTNAQHNVFQVMKKGLEPFDLTPIQYGVLKCIWDFQLNNPKDIADKLNIEGSTLSGILERMEAKELITRKIDSDDRRFICINLTEKGKSLENNVNDIVEEVNRNVLSDFSDKEVLQLRQFLKNLAEVSC